MLYLKHGHDVPESAVRALVRDTGVSAVVSRGGGGGGATQAEVAAIKSIKTLSEDPTMLSRVYGRRVVNGHLESTPRPCTEDELAKRWIQEARVRYDAYFEAWTENKERFPRIEDKHDYDFFTKIKSIVMYNSGNVQGYFLKESILNPNVTHRRFNLFLVKNTGLMGSEQFFIIMDTDIFDGMITPRIHKGMTAIDARKEEGSNPVTRVAPTLAAEVRDLNRVLNKGSGRRMQIIQDLIQHPSLIESEMIR